MRAHLAEACQSTAKRVGANLWLMSGLHVDALR